MILGFGSLLRMQETCFTSLQKATSATKRSPLNYPEKFHTLVFKLQSAISIIVHFNVYSRCKPITQDSFLHCSCHQCLGRKGLWTISALPLAGIATVLTFTHSAASMHVYWLVPGHSLESLPSLVRRKWGEEEGLVTG